MVPIFSCRLEFVVAGVIPVDKRVMLMRLKHILSFTFFITACAVVEMSMIEKVRSVRCNTPSVTHFLELLQSNY